MQYAQILIDGPVDKPLTYIIKPEQLPYIKHGALVQVEFSKRKTLGVCLKTTKNISGLDYSKLKKINTVYNIPILPEIFFQFASWLKNYYFTSYAKTFFSLIPIVPIKSEKIQTNFHNSIKNPTELKSLVIGYGQFFAILDKLIGKALKNNQKIRIIIPDLAQKNIISDFINKKYNQKPLIFDNELTAKNRRKSFFEILSNNQQIIIGGRQLGLIPPRQNELWIIEDLCNFSYKETRAPKYNLKDIVKFWQQYTKIYSIEYIPNIYIQAQTISVKPGFKQLIQFIKTPVYPNWQEKWEKILSKDIDFYLPNWEFDKTLNCSKCHTNILSPCCKAKIIYTSNLICSNCKSSLELKKSCKNCQSILTITNGYFLNQIQKLSKNLKEANIKIKKINDLSRSGCSKQAVYWGWDYLFESSDIFAKYEYWKNIKKLASIYPQLLVLTDFEFLQNKNESQINFKQIILNQAQQHKLPPFYKIVKLSLSTKKVTQENLEEIFYPIKKIAIINYFTNEQNQIYDITVNIPINNYHKFRKLYMDNIENHVQLQKLDIDPYNLL